MNEYQRSYFANYYDDNKEIILEKRKVKINCPRCGTIITRYNITKHFKSQKCIKLSKLLRFDAGSY
tara:strand:+ start:159 stop:356 length:198 start_codon:yes stop_codon:yes gene_type:complete